MANVISKKVLVVEDELPILQLYKMKLSSEGFRVATAVNGHTGLKQCEEFRPDLLLLDIRMPEMNGDEMLEKLRATDWGSKIRVIILTNLSRDEAPSVLRFLNVDRYLVKAHHTPKQIVDVVKEVLGTA